MIVRDESANLAECLGSVAGLVDEIVVVDTGSSDDTTELARRAGARVFEFPWVDDFAAARNESIARALGDWIFWMDADDRLPAAAFQTLRDAVRALPDDNVGYLMDVICPGPDGGPMFHVPHVRLFRRRPDIRWTGRVHEQIARPILASGGSLRRLGAGIVHVGYTRRSNRRAKLERNLRLLDLEIDEGTSNVYSLLARAGTLIGLDRAAEALVALNLCLPIGPDREIGRQVAALTAEAWVMEGRLLDALDAVRGGLAEFARDAKLQFQEASLLTALGQLDEAEVCLRAQLLVGEEHGASVAADRSIAAFRARHLLAEVLLERGRPDLAETQARIVIETRPSYGQAWVTLAESLAEQGKATELAVVRRHVDVTLGSAVAGALVRVVEHLASGQAAAALAVLERATAASPDDPFLNRALARTLVALGSHDEALRRVVGAALAADPLCPRTRSIERTLAQPPVPRWLPRVPIDATLRPVVL
jgi:tetratricopeptide (TPR) repeat protein